MFNGQITQAAAGIHRTVGAQRLGRAGIHAQPAVGAWVAGQWGVWRQLQVGQQLPEKQVGTIPGRVEQGVSSNPTQTSPPGGVFFQDWRGIHACAISSRASSQLGQARAEQLQFSFQHNVVIRQERVGSDDALPRLAGRHRGRGSRVGQPDTKDGAAAGQQRGRVLAGAEALRARQEAHVCLKARLNPGLIRAEGFGLGGQNDAANNKAELESLGFDQCFEGHALLRKKR